MYKKVLFAYDPGGTAEGAVPVVTALAKKSGAEVMVVTVQDHSAFVCVLPSQEIHDRTVRVRRRLSEAGIKARQQVRYTFGGPGRSLLDAAREYGPDLVVLGSHGRNGLIAGSVAHRIASGVNCPVLMVHRRNERDGEASIRRVLLAVDDSPQSMLAVETSRRLAEEHGASVVAVHVAQEGSAPSAILTLATDSMRAVRVPVTTRTLVAEGSVADAIVRAADELEADVIVLGSRRHGHAGALLLGSVAREVVHNTTRPVLLAQRHVHESKPAPSRQTSTVS